MAETIQIGGDTQIIDLATGKLTRQGLLILENIGSLSGDFDIHTETAASTSALGHVKKGTAVSDANSSTVSVDAADVSAAPASYTATWGGEVVTLANELKADVNTLKTDLDSATTQLNALLSSLNTAGTIS